MQLAEIYLAYRRITEDNPPRIVLLDHTLSSILLSNDVMHLVHAYRPTTQALGWIEAQIDVWGRQFEPADALVAHAHPMDRSLSVPSWPMNALAECVVARLTDFWKIGETGERDPGTPLPIDTLLRDSEFPLDRDRLVERLTSSTEKHRAFPVQRDRVVPIDSLQNGQARTLRQRWYDLRLLFESVCEALFRERRPHALQLRYPTRLDADRAGWTRKT
jgi:hypothetical protein